MNYHELYRDETLESLKSRLEYLEDNLTETDRVNDRASSKNNFILMRCLKGLIQDNEEEINVLRDLLREKSLEED